MEENENLMHILKEHREILDLIEKAEEFQDKIKDTKSQIIKTFEIVEALIQAEGASLNDICTATIFLKNPKDFSIYQKTAGELGLNEIPAVFIVADVCRCDLLFEIDATFAFSPGSDFNLSSSK